MCVRHCLAADWCGDCYYSGCQFTVRHRCDRKALLPSQSALSHCTFFFFFFFLCVCVCVCVCVGLRSCVTAGSLCVVSGEGRGPRARTAGRSGNNDEGTVTDDKSTSNTNVLQISVINNQTKHNSRKNNNNNKTKAPVIPTTKFPKKENDPTP